MLTEMGTLEEQAFEAGDVLIAQGEPNDRLLLIGEGQLQVHIEAEGREAILGEKGPGQWVGELGMMSPGPACATVHALSPGRGQVVSHALYKDWRASGQHGLGRMLSQISCDLARRIRSSGELRLEEHPSRVSGLLQALHGVDREDVDVRWVPRSAADSRSGGLSTDEILELLETSGALGRASGGDEAYEQAIRSELSLLASTFATQQHEEGDVIVREGEPADGVFVILKGRVRVEVSAHASWFHVDRVLEPGAVFGTLAFFDDGTRSATCTALEETLLAVIYPAAVRDLLASGEADRVLGLHVMDWFARQLVEDARQLNAALARRLGSKAERSV